MQITACKNQQNHSTLSRDIGSSLFQRTLGMLDYTQLKQHNTVASMMCNNLQQINKIARSFLEILILYFRKCWVCLGMHDQT